MSYFFKRREKSQFCGKSYVWQISTYTRGSYKVGKCLYCGHLHIQCEWRWPPFLGGARAYLLKHSRKASTLPSYSLFQYLGIRFG